jgi:hypothetical protein
VFSYFVSGRLNIVMNDGREEEEEEFGPGDTPPVIFPSDNA